MSCRFEEVLCIHVVRKSVTFHSFILLKMYCNWSFVCCPIHANFIHLSISWRLSRLTLGLDILYHSLVWSITSATNWGTPKWLCATNWQSHWKSLWFSYLLKKNFFAPRSQTACQRCEKEHQLPRMLHFCSPQSASESKPFYISVRFTAYSDWTYSDCNELRGTLWIWGNSLFTVELYKIMCHRLKRSEKYEEKKQQQ